MVDWLPHHHQLYLVWDLRVWFDFSGVMYTNLKNRLTIRVFGKFIVFTKSKHELALLAYDEKLLQRFSQVCKNDYYY